MNVEPIEILLVEDNPDDVELTLRALSRHGLANHVRVVRDGVEALNFLFPDPPPPVGGQPQPRLVLLDLKLPRIDGLEVLRRLKASETMRLIPVVVLTSSEEEGDLIASYQLGTNSYIVKPVNFDSFAAVIGQIGLYWLLVNTVPDELR